MIISTNGINDDILSKIINGICSLVMDSYLKLYISPIIVVKMVSTPEVCTGKDIKGCATTLLLKELAIYELELLKCLNFYLGNEENYYDLTTHIFVKPHP